MTALTRYLRPRAWSTLRKASSGPVSRERFACITVRAAADDAGGEDGRRPKCGAT